MKRKELIRRYTLFVCSVLFNSLSIAVITKALLGTSPISSVPYVLSLISPPTMGQFTIYMNFLFILLEMSMMKRKEIREKWYELAAQIPITLLFGSCIDLSMYALQWLEPTYYLSRLFVLLIGAFLLGLGISWEVKANVSMVTGEYLVRILSRFLNKEFGFVKVGFDVTLVIIASVTSFFCLGRIEGVREGTLVAALLVGPISHILMPCWTIFDRWLNPTEEGEETTPEGKPRAYPLIITITREVGSGGRLLGKALAKELGIKYYDRELVALVAKDSQLPEKYIADNEQRVSSSYLMHIILEGYGAAIENNISPRDALFVSQSRVIRRLAAEEPCVIIGRCSDYILKDYPKRSIIRIFCYTDLDEACRRCVEEYGVAADRMPDFVVESNRSRISHYQYYTGRKWGDPHYYDLTINTGNVPLQTACSLVVKLYQEKLKAQQGDA